MTLEAQQQQVLQNHPRYCWENPFLIASRDSRLSGLEPDRLSRAVSEALNTNYNANNHNLPLKADHIYEAHHRVEAGKRTQPMIERPIRLYDQALEAQPKKPQTLSQIRESQARGTQKVMGGMTLLFAAFSSLEALKSASRIQENDADGKTSTQWSQVGITILNTALALGLAYAGVQQMRGRSVF